MPHLYIETGRRIHRNRRRGFILLSTLTAFLISLMMIPLCMRCIAAFPVIFRPPQSVQDEIAAMQLRRLFALAEDIEVSYAVVDLTYQKKRMSLHLSNDNVILSPGTQICFTNVEDCRFVTEDGILVIVIERENSSVEKVLSPIS